MCYPLAFATSPLFYRIHSSSPSCVRPCLQWIFSSANPSQASTNYKEAFALFDKRGNGRVALESLGDLLRACGQNPTLAEIRDLEKGVGGDCTFLDYS